MAMKVLIIDCDALGWQVFHALPALTYNGRGTGVIYGFLDTLINVQSTTHADRIVFAWDSQESKRIKLFPEYKLKRRTKKKEYTKEEMIIHRDRIDQFKTMKNFVLPGLGFSNVFAEEGYEGDDIIASIALKYRKKHLVKIIARDGDLYQLINGNCSMYDTQTNTYMDEEWFFEKYGIYPDMWADVKKIAGCTTDEVPGIKGIGEGYAIKYLLNKMKEDSKLYQRIKENKKTIKLTKKLVVLPFKGTPKYKLKKDKCNVGSFKKVAKEFGFKSFLTKDKLIEYKSLFC